MRTAAVFALCLTSSTLYAATPAADPSQFTVKIHVLYSQVILNPDGKFAPDSKQQLDASIGTQQVRLLSEDNLTAVLAAGDYLAKGPTQQKHRSSKANYDLAQAYELLLPDGQTRTYDVVGLGTAVPNP